MSNHDIDRFFNKDKNISESNSRTCIWRVNYEASGKIENVEELANEPIDMNDYIDIVAGADCREAITKAETYIMSEEFPISVETIIITGVKKLAEAEI